MAGFPPNDRDGSPAAPAGPVLHGSSAARPRRALPLVALAGAIGALAVSTAPIPALAAGPASQFLQSAHQLERQNDLRGAEIQLRNAAQAEPGNPAILLELAQIYLRLGNPNGAQAEIFAAHMRGAKEEATAPLMAQAMLETGQFGDLLKNVPVAKRPPKTESLVRTYRGMAQLALGETSDAQIMLSDAERLDPSSVLPKIADARLLLQQRKLDEAEKKINDALVLVPKNSQALEIRGLIYLMRGKISAAIGQLNAAISAGPHNIEALLDRANVELNLGQVDRADNDIKSAQTLAPGNGMAMFLRAQLDARQGKDKDADALLNRLRGVMSNIPQAYLLAAEVKLKLNQTDLAEDDLNKFVAQRPGDPKGWQTLGIIAMRRGDTGSAIAKLERARVLAPKDPDTLGLLGQAYLARGDNDKARVLLDQAALELPNNQSLQTERALSQFASGQSQASLSALGAIFKGGTGSLAAGPPLALEALQSGRIDVAAAAAEALVRRDPGNVFYQQLLALVRAGQHNYPAAETILRGILAKQPNLLAARRNLAEIYVSTNRVPQAKKLYQDLLQKSPADAASIEALADIDVRTRNYDEALKLLSHAQDLDTKAYAPGLAIVALLESQKKWPDAIARARALQQKFPGNADVADSLGRAYYESGDQASSVATYGVAASAFPKSGPIAAHYAAVLTAAKNYPRALEASTRAIALDPGSTVLKASVVYLTFMAKGADAAVAASESFVPQGKPSEPSGIVMTLEVLEQSGRRPDAVALAEARLARSPSGALATTLAGLYQRSGQTDRAIAYLEKWTKAHATDGQARFGLAQLYGAAGKTDLARAQYEWLLSQKPDDAVVLNNLAWLYSLSHDPRARSMAQKAAALAPQSGAIADTLGWILIGQGDHAGAIKYLQQASTSQPDDLTVQYHYAVALSQNGRANEAKGILEKLLAGKPNPETMSAARTLLASLGRGH